MTPKWRGGANVSRGAYTTTTEKLKRAKEADKPTVEVEECGTKRVEERCTGRVVVCEIVLDKERERGVRAPGEKAGVTN